ncbi:MAG: PQQ-dependent sugar dehydrogenase [Planctomycetes bacterium]|nr:PQQ-dependent sugar dehydrogenase [Planctomycetota bacterium]
MQQHTLPSVHASRTLGLLLALAPICGEVSAQTPLRTIPIASGLSRPVDIQTPRGDRHRLFIVEQTGTIRVVKNGVLLVAPFLNLTSSIACCGERGLLGLAFHPKFASNGYLFVNYTASGSGATMIDRYTVSATNPDVADPSSRKPVLGPITQPFSNHNGGCLRFGPDGYLYIGTGDGGSAGDPNCNAQRGDVLLGKMLRIDVDTVAPYAVPSTNPFVGNSAVLDEIWAVGLRNPWRFSFDRETGDLYIGDVGQNALEELDFQPATSRGGENYGWKIMEGTNCYSTSACPTGTPACNDPRLIKPIHQYGRTEGASITGGYVYRGCAIPDLKGTYFFADYVRGRIWSFRYNGTTMSEFKERTSELSWSGPISAFGEDDCGELYVCNYSTSGSVHKIVASAPAPAVDLGYGKVGGNGLVPEFSACGLLGSGSSAQLRLFDAPPQALVLLWVGNASNPTPLFGGTVVPVPVLGEALLVADSEGRVVFTIPGGGGPQSLFAQYLILDPGATSGIGISNALRVDLAQ